LNLEEEEEDLLAVVVIMVLRVLDPGCFASKSHSFGCIHHSQVHSSGVQFGFSFFQSES